MAELQGANLYSAELQGASLTDAQLQNASLGKARVWRARGMPTLDLTALQDIDTKTQPWDSKEKPGTFAQWRDAIANSIPAGPGRDLLRNSLAALDLAANKGLEGVLESDFWKTARSSQPQGEELERKRAAFLASLACSSDSAPYIARGLLRNLKSEFDASKSTSANTGARQLFANELRKAKSDPTACPGVNGFTEKDWAILSNLSPDI
jgi:hypothetical protein